MKSLIISTVGTSLITNPATKDEVNLMYQYSNTSALECPQNIKQLIDTLVPKITNKLSESNNHEVRRMSAELNGIFGFYNEKLNNRNEDLHFLITTNTYQGIRSAEIVRDYLRIKGLTCDIFTPQNLSTKNKDLFSEGIKELLKWFDETIDNYKKSGYQIIFNLTGGFKSLQGYLNTIAMFYSDKIIYIFESEHAELIEIPRLPIKIDIEPFERNKEKLLLLNANKIFNVNEFVNLPETIFDTIDNQLILSVWGEIIWNKIKYDLFDKIPKLPFLEYHNDFIKAFNDNVDKRYKMKLLETIAKVSVILENNNGNTSELSRGGIQLSPLESKKFESKQVYHFRSNLGIRINCIKNDNNLFLTEFGTHDQTQRN